MKAIVGALLLIVTCYAIAGGQDSPQALVGSWNYESMTNLKDGKPFGTVHFKPGQLTIAFNPDGSWARERSDTGRETASWYVQGPPSMT
jgi:hypothetical protein